MSDASLRLGPPARVDVGLGTAYERWAVYELLKRWLPPWEIRTALEGPVDGMAGIPGLHLLPAAALGARVTVLVPDREAADTVSSVYRLLGLGERLDARVAATWPKDESFDLVFSYNALPFVDGWRRYLADAAGHAARLLVVSTTHPASYGVFLRRLMRLVEPHPHPAELFDHEAIRAPILEPALSAFGTIVEDAYVDCPWWPDLFVETGQTLVSGTLGRLPFGKRFLRSIPSPTPTGKDEPFLHGPEKFPFFSAELRSEELGPALRRHPALDTAPRPLAALFAHHRIRAVERKAQGER